MFALFSLAALLMGCLRCLPVSSLPSSSQKTCYLKPSPQGNNNYETSYTYVPDTDGAAVVFLWPEEETMSAVTMNISISQIQRQIAPMALDQDVPNGRLSSTTSQSVDYYLEEGYRGDLKYQHIAWSLDALRSVLLYRNIFNNTVITVSDGNSGGLCAVGGFRLSGDDPSNTGSSSPQYTPQFVTFNYPDPSNSYNSPVPSPAASDYPSGFGTLPVPSNDGASGSVLNQSADDTTAQVY